MASDGSIILSTQVDTGGLEKGLSSIKNGVASFGKAFAVAGAAGVAVFAGITKAAVDSYSEFEQLKGGVQKIFDEIDYSKIAADAGEAYKTMGMSANEYLGVMTTVGANFASTIGDAKGYEVAKQGMQAISDFASGTGRSVDELSEKYQMITRSTSVYQSIADQFAGILPATSAGFLEQAQAAGFLSDSYTKLTEVPMAEYQEAVTQMLSKGVNALGLTGNTAMEASTTLSGSIAMMKSSWQNLLTGLADTTQNFEVLLQNFISSVATFVSNLLPVLATATQGVLQMVQGLLPQIPALIEQMLPIVIEGVSGIITGLVAVLPQIANAIIELLPQIMTAILTLLPQLAEAGFQIISTIGSGIVENAPLLVEFISGAVGQLVQGAFEAMPTPILIISGILGSLVSGMSAYNTVIAVKTALDTIHQKGLLATAAAQLGLNTAMLASPITWVIAGITALVAAFVILWNKSEGFRNFWIGLWEVIKSAAQAVWDAIKEFFASAWENIQAIWESASDFFSVVWEGIKSVFSVVGEWFSVTFSAAIEAIQSAWSGVTSFFSGIWAGITEVFLVVGSWFANIFSEAWQGIQSAWSGVSNFFSTVWSGITAVFSVVGGWFSNIFAVAWSGVQAAWSGVTSFFTNIWGGITAVFSAVSSWFGNIFSQAWSAIQGAWSGVTQFFTGVWTKIKSVFTNAVSSMTSIGKNIVEGLWNGIGNAAKWLSDKLKTFCSNALGTIKSFFGIHSPSTVMRDDVGLNIALGVMEGIDKGMPYAMEMLEKWNSDLYDQSMRFLLGYKQTHKTTAKEEREFWEYMLSISVQGTEAFRKIYHKLLNAQQREAEEAKNGIVETVEEVEEVVEQAFKEINFESAKQTAIDNLSKPLIEGIKNGADASAEALLKVAETRLEEYQFFNEMTLEEELEYWKKVYQQIEEGTEESLQIIKKAYELEKKIQEEANEEALKQQEETEQKKLDAQKEFSEKALEHHERMEAERKKLDDERKEREQKQAEEAEQRQKDFIESAERYHEIRLNQEKVFSEGLENIQQKANEKIEELTQKQNNLASKLSSYGDIFAEKTKIISTDLEEPLVKTFEGLADLDPQIQFLDNYYNALNYLNSKENMPDSLFAQLRDMEIEEGAKYANMLIALSDEEFEEYVKDWEEKQRKSDKIAKLLYKEEADAIQTEIDALWQGFEESFFEKGENAGAQFFVGFLQMLARVMPSLKSSIDTAISKLYASDEDVSDTVITAKDLYLASGRKAPEKSGFPTIINAGWEAVQGAQDLVLRNIESWFTQRGYNTPIILELDGQELGRAVVDTGSAETRRRGTNLVIA